MLNKKRLMWLIWLMLLILSAFVVPYLFIGEISRVTASFLFWTLFAITAIISTIKIIGHWRV